MAKARNGRDIDSMTPGEILEAFDLALERAAKRVRDAKIWATPHFKATVVDVTEPDSPFEDKPG